MSALSSRLAWVPLAFVLLLVAAAWPQVIARAQTPLSPVTGLEVVGELRPGTPNIPLLLVVQWNPVSGAESYELEQAEPAPTPAERVFVALATLTAEDRRPNGKIGYVDEAGFASAGGDCFRVRAVAGNEVSEWAETCIEVPPSSGGPPPAEAFEFSVEFTADWEFTLFTWRVQPGYYGPFTITEDGGPSPVATLPAKGGPGRLNLVLPRYGGIFRLETSGLPPIQHVWRGYPTDMQPPAALELVQGVPSLVVLETGRVEAPIAVAWPPQGGPEAVFRVERVTTFGVFEIATLSRRATSFQGWNSDAQVFLDSEPDGEQQCYRVTQISYLGESLIGEGCLGDSPGPPDAGTGRVPAADGSAKYGLPLMVGILLIAFAATAWPGKSRER